MNFLNVSLLAGGLLAAIPVVMHMLSRRQPKELVFPSIRFVRAAQVAAKRGWQVKHWLLLASRVAIVALMATLLAAPHVHSAMLATYLTAGGIAFVAAFLVIAGIVAWVSGRPRWISLTLLTTGLVGLFGGIGWGAVSMMTGIEPPLQTSTGPIATVFVIDDSPTMEYQQENLSRMAQAQESIRQVIGRLPLGSQIAILASDSGVRLSADRAVAERQLSRVQPSGTTADLPQRISKAIQLVRESELERKEIYVVTDMRVGAWSNSTGSVRSLLSASSSVPNDGTPGDVSIAADENSRKLSNQQTGDVLLQLIDVSSERYSDWNIENLRLSQQRTVPGGAVEIQADVAATADSPAAQLSVELFRESLDLAYPILRNGEVELAPSQLTDRQIVDLAPGKMTPVTFQLRDLSEGTHHASIRLQRPDPLEGNNQLHVVVEVRPQRKILIVSDDRELGRVLRAMISPQDFLSDTSEPRTVLSSTSRLATTDFQPFAAIVLFDPGGLDEGLVARIDRFVREGGGLLTILGSQLQKTGLNADTIPAGEASTVANPIQNLLPGTAKRIFRRPKSDRSVTVFPVRPQHPIFQPFAGNPQRVLWQRYSVQRFWEIDLADDAIPIMQFTGSNKPAVIEQPRGFGNILTLTTPIPEPAFAPDRAPWSDLTSGSDYAWESFALLSGMSTYISGWGQSQLNLAAGQPSVLDNDESMPSQYDLFSPAGEVIRISATGSGVTYPFTQQTGAYRLKGLVEDRTVVRGFAVNYASGQFDYARITDDALDDMLGENMYSVAQKTEDLTTSIGNARSGRQLFPFLVCLMLFIWIAEQFLSAYFYSIRLSPKA